MSVISVDKNFDTLTLTVVAQSMPPIERVWPLWADPRQPEHWWGPPNRLAIVDQHDLPAG